MAPELHLCLGRRIVSISRSHIRTYTPGRTSLNEGSAQQTQTTNIHVLSGIRAHDPSKRETADPGLRPHCHRDLLFPDYTHQKQEIYTALSRLNAADCVGRLCSVQSSRFVPSARLSTAR